MRATHLVIRPINPVGAIRRNAQQRMTPQNSSCTIIYAMGPTPDVMHRSPSNESLSDNSSMSGQEGGNSTAVPYYTANIFAACEAANAPRPNHLSTEEEVQLAKRRRSNRLSARRWRNRKKRNFTELRNQILELSKEQSELLLEKSKLEQELKSELQLASSSSVRLPSSLPRGLGFRPRPVSEFDMLFRSLLASQSQAHHLIGAGAFMNQDHHSIGAGAIINHQGLGNVNVDPLTFNALNALQRNLPFSLGNVAALPQTSPFLNSNEACAVSALLKGFNSEG